MLIGELIPIGGHWNKALLLYWNLCPSAQLLLHYNKQVNKHKAAIAADTAPIHLLISKWPLPYIG